MVFSTSVRRNDDEHSCAFGPDNNLFIIRFYYQFILSIFQ